VKSTAKGNPTEGRVYGGDTGLVHIPDGERATFGIELAGDLDAMMRENAENREFEELWGENRQSLCPGCYMVAGYNMLTELARQNGQDLKELGAAMSAAFKALAEGGPDVIEHIYVPREASDSVSVPTEALEALLSAAESGYEDMGRYISDGFAAKDGVADEYIETYNKYENAIGLVRAATGGRKNGSE
jgi:hypothetical protein